MAQGQQSPWGWANSTRSGQNNQLQYNGMIRDQQRGGTNARRVAAGAHKVNKLGKLKTFGVLMGAYAAFDYGFQAIFSAPYKFADVATSATRKLSEKAFGFDSNEISSPNTRRQQLRNESSWAQQRHRDSYPAGLPEHYRDAYDHYYTKPQQDDYAAWLADRSYKSRRSAAAGQGQVALQNSIKNSRRGGRRQASLGPAPYNSSRRRV